MAAPQRTNNDYPRVQESVAYAIGPMQLGANNDSVLSYESGNSTASQTADASVASGASTLVSVTISQTAAAAPTAGVLTIYDNTAESGTVLFTTYISTSVIVPYTLTLNKTAGTGIYAGFDATLAGVTVNIGYRTGSF